MFLFCIRLKKDVTRNVIESLLELNLDDSLLYSLEKEYSTGGTQQQRQQRAVGVGGKSILKDKKKQMKDQEEEEETFMGISKETATTVTGVIGATILAGLGAMLMMGGGESRGVDTERERKDEL